MIRALMGVMVFILDICGLTQLDQFKHIIFRQFVISIEVKNFECKFLKLIVVVIEQLLEPLKIRRLYNSVIGIVWRGKCAPNMLEYSLAQPLLVSLNQKVLQSLFGQSTLLKANLVGKVVTHLRLFPFQVKVLRFWLTFNPFWRSSVVCPSARVT